MMHLLTGKGAEDRLAGLLRELRQNRVFIRRGDRPVAVVLSIEEYQRLLRSDVEAFQQFADEVAEEAKAHGMTEEKLLEILADADASQDRS